MIEKDKVRPYLFSELIRVGNQFDGGYVVPGKALKNCNFLLSLGINDDISFDLQFSHLKKDICCIGVDFTVNPTFFTQEKSSGNCKIFYKCIV